MPKGIVRAGDFRNGNPVPATQASFVSNPIPAAQTYWNSNPIPATASFNTNVVNWLPSPAHFGNAIP